MNILIAHDSKIPALTYGGIQRVIWDLGEELVRLGHKITYLVNQGSYCSFADVLFIDFNIPLQKQIPEHIDIVHFHFPIEQEITTAYIATIHGTPNQIKEYNFNTTFVSQNHASRFGSDQFVYNGLNFDNFIKADLKHNKKYTHFLGKAAWRLKNIKGAINIAKKADTKLYVLGGKRFNIKMGIRFTFSPKVKFFGMVDNEQKQSILKYSSALIHPVLVHEAFGLAITESMYYGNPIFATPYGSLPELVPSYCGVVSTKSTDLIDGVKNRFDYNREDIHNHALLFSAKNMAKEYLNMYEKVLNGKQLNTKAPKLQVLDEKFLPFN